MTDADLVEAFEPQLGSEGRKLVLARCRTMEVRFPLFDREGLYWSAAGLVWCVSHGQPAAVCAKLRVRRTSVNGV